jgi:hypothetical protein
MSHGFLKPKIEMDLDEISLCSRINLRKGGKMKDRHAITSFMKAPNIFIP